MQEMPEPASVEQRRESDLKPLLGQELLRLPDKYRLAVVLCDLEGQTYQEVASVWVSASLWSSTIQATRMFAAGQRAAAGVISVQVAILTEGVLETMLLTKWKLATLVVLAGSLIGLSTTAITTRTLASAQDRVVA